MLIYSCDLKFLYHFPNSGQQGTCFFASWNDKTYIFTCVHNVVKRFNGMDRFRNMTEEEQRKLLQTALEKLYIIFPDKSGKLPSRPKDDEKFGIPFDKFVFDVSDVSVTFIYTYYKYLTNSFTN